MATRRTTTQQDHMYVADFETCDAWQQESEVFPDQRVWLAGLMNLDDLRFEYWDNLDDFMERILSRGDNCNTEIAFHNLKFDGSYIIPWLFKHGFEVCHEKPEKGQFSVLIDERNAWYTVTIQVTTKRKVTLWDSLKLFPTQLEYIHNVYGTPTKKKIVTEEFYQAYRPEDHELEYEELEYLHNDLRALAETLRAHIDFYGIRFKKTQASQSFWNFEQTFKAWKMRFPPLELEVDKKIRPAYWGGLSHVNRIHQGNDIFGVEVYDINSSYPYQLAEKKLPYGEPTAIRSDGRPPDMSKFWVAEILCRFKVKGGKQPCIPTKAITEGKPITSEHWLSDSDGTVKLSFCCIDYITFLENYEVTILEWCWVIHWPWKVQKEIARLVHENNRIKVDYKNQARSESDPLKAKQLLIQSNRAKIDNNSFYGKFGEDIVKKGKTPYFYEEEVIYKQDREDIMTMHKRRFLPVAMAVTAWGRRQLMEVVNLLGPYFVYCDTDSVHFQKGGLYRIKEAIKDGVLSVDPVRLGAWDHEGSFDWGRYLRAKCYMEGRDGDYEVTLAGLPADKHTGQNSKKRSCCTPDNFRIGLVIPGGNGKLRTVRTPTGNKLVPTDFVIQENFSFTSY